MEEKIYEVTEIKTAETLAVKIRTTVRSTQKIMLDAAISIGQDLIDAKELVAHGEWENWLENSVGFSQSSANKYMKISREFGDESKTELIPNLSYTKALKLLAVPEEDRKEFVENNDVEDLTVKELEQKIKELETENETIKEKLKESSELEKAKETMEKNLQELKTQIAELELEEAQEPSEEIKGEIEKHKADLEKEKKKLETATKKNEKLQQEIKDLKDSQDKTIEEAKIATAEEAREVAKKEVEEEMDKLLATVDDANKAKLEAEKKLAIASNEDIIQIKIIINRIQEEFSNALEVIDNIANYANDQEQADKLAAGLKTIMSKLIESL